MDKYNLVEKVLPEPQLLFIKVVMYEPQKSVVSNKVCFNHKKLLLTKNNFLPFGVFPVIKSSTTCTKICAINQLNSSPQTHKNMTEV